MPLRRKISLVLREEVRQRADYRGEYCHASETWQYVEFTLEHIVPLTEGGGDESANLALACFACNRRKWDKRQGFDPETQTLQRFFNPRQDVWHEHFVWSADGLTIIGLTPIGRATISGLELNRDRAKLIRAADTVVGRHPPSMDPRLLK